MVAINNFFRYGNKYDNYISEPKERTIDKVEAPRSYNGKVEAGWDDYEQDIIEEMGKVNGIRLQGSG